VASASKSLRYTGPRRAILRRTMDERETAHQPTIAWRARCQRSAKVRDDEMCVLGWLNVNASPAAHMVSRASSAAAHDCTARRRLQTLDGRRLPTVVHDSARARLSESLFQASRGSAAARANIQSRTRSWSSSRRSAKRRIDAFGSLSKRFLQLKRCWVAS
jgi:hypothetical protein